MSGVTQTATYARLRSLFQGIMDEDSGLAQASSGGLSGREHDANLDQVVLPINTSLNDSSFSGDVNSEADFILSIDDISSVQLDVAQIKPPRCNGDVAKVAMAAVESELSQPSLARPDVGATENVLNISLGPFENDEDVNVASTSRLNRQQSKVAGDLVA